MNIGLPPLDNSFLKEDIEYLIFEYHNKASMTKGTHTTNQFLAIILYYIKGTHTVYFSSSLYIINQKPIIHRPDLHCIIIWVARSSG